MLDIHFLRVTIVYFGGKNNSVFGFDIIPL